MYVTREDAAWLLGVLNADDEIAFLVAAGPGRWKARRMVDELPAGRTMALWHIPSGPLPLVGTTNSDIPDPFAGWQEQVTGMDPTVPYFENHAGVVWLTYRPDGLSRGSACGLSSFQWIGDHYAVIGKPAPETTERWWAGLICKVEAAATLVPRKSLTAPSPPEIHAFPAALRLLNDGKTFDQN